MLAGRAEPLAVGDDHERGPQAGRVVAVVAGITQQDLGGKRWGCGERGEEDSTLNDRPNLNTTIKTTANG